jgi:hypothetical protein
MARDALWEKVARQFKADCRMSNARCWLCLNRGDHEMAGIDYDAPRHSPHGFEADHKKPWISHPHLRYSRENLRASHTRCNRARRESGESLNSEAVQHEWVKPDW